MPPAIDLSGQKRGRLLVIRRHHRKGKHYFWECLCDCGKTAIVRMDRPRLNDSCGCFMAERLADGIGKSHGHARKGSISPEYISWMTMVYRCSPPPDPSKITAPKSDYYMKGVRVCDRWRGDDGFSNFLEDMGPRPSRRHSIDRIKSDGHYEPSNCRWATPAEQRRNSTRIVALSHNGETLCLSDWATRLGIKRDTLKRMTLRGMTIGDIIDSIRKQNGTLLTTARGAAPQ